MMLAAHASMIGGASVPGIAIQRVRFAALAFSGNDAGVNYRRMQLSRIAFATPFGEVFSWPEGTTVTANIGHEGNESPQNVIGSVTSINNKFCSRPFYDSNLPIYLTIEMPYAALTPEYSLWRWYTANDAARTPNRDPVSFSMQIELDGQWVDADVVTSHTAIKKNNTLSYQGLWTGVLSPWINPYVTNGLVAMWDGERAAGANVGQGDGSVFVDLVSGDAALLTGTSATGSKFVQTNKNGYFSPSRSIGQMLYDKANSTGLTVEILYSPIAIRTNNFGMVCVRRSETGTNENNYTALSLRQNNGSNSDMEIRLNGVTGNFSYTSYHYLDRYTCKAIGKWTGQKMSCCFEYNSVVYNSVWKTVSPASYTVTSMSIGSDRRVNVNGCKFFSIRFYDRILTATELQAQNAVDNARYGTTFTATGNNP